MQELHLVGFTTDRRHLIFSSRQGSKSGSFLVPVDEELLDAVEGLSADTADRKDAGEDFDEEVIAPAAEPRVDAKLSVREVQARLRAGVAVEEIAARAEVDPAWVERFAPPIRAEQQQIVTRALGARMERSRAGKSALTLRDAVSRSMAERDLTFTAESFASAWSSRLVGADLWSIEFTFSHRGRRRTVSWTYEATGGTLTTSDRLASQIGFVAGEAPSRTETHRSSTEGDDRSSSDGGGRAPARRPAAKKNPAAKKKSTTTTKKAAAKKKAAKKKAAKKKAAAKKTSAAKKKKTATKKPATKKPATKKTSVAKRKTAAKKSAAKRKAAKKPAKKTATGAGKRTGTRKKALPTATRVAAARKDATERLERATAKRVAAARKAAQRKSVSAQKDAERRVAAEEKAAARVAREAEAQRRADQEAEAESSAEKDREAARAVAAAERQLAEERSSAARDAAERAAAAPPAVAPDDTSGADDDSPSVAVDAGPAPTIGTVERRPDQAVVRLRAPQPSVPAEDPAARVAARRARAAERSVSTAQFRSGSAVQAASTPVNGAGSAVPEGVRRRDPREGEAPAGGGVGRPRSDGRRTRTRQLRAR